MRFRIGMTAAFLTGCAVVVSAAQAPPPFAFTPEPRWKLGPLEEPATEDVCAAIKRECSGIKDISNIEAPFSYDALYDVKGNLVGMRVTKGTGCAPLDESLLLGQRRFILIFHKEGKPDLDDIHAEVAPGVDPDQVRIVKASGTNLSMGCNP